MFPILFACGSLVLVVALRSQGIFEQVFKKHSLKISLSITAIFLLLTTLQFPTMILVGFFGSLYFFSFAGPIFSQKFNEIFPSHIRATGLSIVSMVIGIYTVIMGLVLGAVADYFSIFHAFAFSGLLVFLAGILTSFLPKEKREI